MVRIRRHLGYFSAPLRQNVRGDEYPAADIGLASQWPVGNAGWYPPTPSTQVKCETGWSGPKLPANHLARRESQ
jgi:glutathione S-transferase